VRGFSSLVTREEPGHHYNQLISWIGQHEIDFLRAEFAKPVDVREFA